MGFLVHKLSRSRSVIVSPLLLYMYDRKRGTPKENNADELQLCAQAICLEEMFQTAIPEGYLYYGENRRRTPVRFTEGWIPESIRKSSSAYMIRSLPSLPAPGLVKNLLPHYSPRILSDRLSSTRPSAYCQYQSIVCRSQKASTVRRRKRSLLIQWELSIKYSRPVPVQWISIGVRIFYHYQNFKINFVCKRIHLDTLIFLFAYYFSGVLARYSPSKITACP